MTRLSMTASEQAEGAGGPRILLVDDEPRIRDFISRALETAGFQNIRVWRDVTAPTKARLKIARGEFPCRRVVVSLIPAFLGLVGCVGAGNKLMAVATKV